MLQAVIMAGGSGTRFWPLSRRRRPKQFLRLAGARALLQQAADRLSGWVPPERTWVVTNAAQLEQTMRLLPRVPAANCLAEPVGRNTAPCLGLAAIQLLAVDPDAVMLAMPADHMIWPDEAFREAAARAEAIVRRQPRALVLFGVTPSRPATGFGYVERGEPLADAGAKAFGVASFREKPDRATAEEYVAAGRFLWNCGVFVWRAETILAALEEFEPAIHVRLKRLAESIGRATWAETLAAEFAAMPAISIDHAVLERARDVCVIEAPFAWDDVGNWQAVARLRPADSDGNWTDGPFVGLQTRRCIVRSTDDHLVATAGVEGLVIVHTPDATLVARQDDEDALRALVARLEETGHGRFL